MNNAPPETEPQPIPRAFISHSAADDDFCHALYDALLALGIRPVMDKRDFQPGDDLVKQIFDEGIGQADAIIFVLSAHSVDRPWAREELSVGVVRKLAQQTRLIPLLINGLPNDRVPPALSATLWIRVGEDGKSLAAAAAEIARTLHGDKNINPTIAPAPTWTQRAIANIRGLSAVDEVLFAFICEQRLTSLHPFVATNDILTYAQEQGVTVDELETSFAVLEGQGVLDLKHQLGSRLPYAIRPTAYGLTRYLSAYKAEEYAIARRDVVAAIINQQVGSLIELEAIVSAPLPILDHILNELDEQGELHVVRSMGGAVAFRAKPILRRLLQ